MTIDTDGFITIKGRARRFATFHGARNARLEVGKRPGVAQNL